VTTPTVGKGRGRVLDDIRAIRDYVKSLYGFLSGIPGAIVVLDRWGGWLPISSALKPWIYVLTAGSVLYVLFAEVSRYIQSLPGSAELKQMGRRATVHFVWSVVCIGFHFVGVRWLTPDSVGEVWLNATLFVLMLLFAVATMEITRSLAILGLRIYVVKYRA
jgi:hypothetical protein